MKSLSQGDDILQSKNRKPNQAPIVASSIAAIIESFYRSFMNASYNALFTSQKSISYFPNMHIQIPVRIIYVNGYKGIRNFANDTSLDSSDTTLNRKRFLAAAAPGVSMTPFCSFLEACNAEAMNPEPMQRRWMRGMLPRCCREIIFGIGLNEATDYIEDEIDFIQIKILRNASASVLAGVISGYCSQLPHNLCTMKMLYPTKSYYELFDVYTNQISSRFVAHNLSLTAKRFLSVFAGIFLPPGLLLRTTQIVGSFVILNGTINMLQDILE